MRQQTSKAAGHAQGGARLQIERILDVTRWAASRVTRRLPFRRPLTRASYQRVWDSVSILEYDAKISVAGIAAEHDLLAAAYLTRDSLLATVGIHPTDTVLEIGAGIGRVGSVLAPLCSEWIGGDVSPNMLRHLRRRLATLPNVRTVHLNGYDLDGLETSSVDVIYCTVVFMHLDEWERYTYIRDSYRVLRPGGRLYVDSVNMLAEHGWAFFQKMVDDYSLTDRPPHISKTSTPQELHAYFSRAGFVAIQQFTAEHLWLVTHAVKPG